MAQHKTSRALILGSALLTVSTASIAATDLNPFGATQLAGGYDLRSQQTEGKCGGDKAEKSAEGKCGEGKCGGDKAEKAAEGKCGEGKCGGDKAEKAAEGKCGGDKAAKTEGKCGGA